MDIRRASGIGFFGRVDLQTQRDELIHRLDELDRQLDELADQRRAIIDELTELREALYPPVAWCHGRRPPNTDCGPLPPAPEGAQAIGGRDLRVTCLTILRRHGPLSLPELHGLLHRYGYLIGTRHVVRTLSDAMAYEVEQHRARRLERGVYEAVDAEPRRTRRRHPPVPDDAEPWFPHAPAQLDPDLDEDPPTWMRPPRHRRPC